MQDEQGNVMDPYLGCVTDHLPDADINIMYEALSRVVSSVCNLLISDLIAPSINL